MCTSAVPDHERDVHVRCGRDARGGSLREDATRMPFGESGDPGNETPGA